MFDFYLQRLPRCPSAAGSPFSSYPSPHPNPPSAPHIAAAAVASTSTAEERKLASYLDTLDPKTVKTYGRIAPLLVDRGICQVDGLSQKVLDELIPHVMAESTRLGKSELTSSEMWNLKVVIAALKKKRKEEGEREA